MLKTILTLLAFTGSIMLQAQADFFDESSVTMEGYSGKQVFIRRGKKVNGVLYIAGHSNGAIGTSAVGGMDMFIRKYPSGSYRSTPSWTKMFGTSGTDYLGGFTVDSAGNIYAVGQCFGTVNSIATQGSGDACVFKLNSAGAVQCSNQYGGTGADLFSGVEVDEARGYFYAVGNSSSTSFDGKTIQNKAGGIWSRFSTSTCAKAGDSYVQDMPYSPPRIFWFSFGGVVVLPTGQTVAAFAMGGTSSSPQLTIAGTALPMYANGGTYGFLKINNTVSGPVPVGVVSVAGTGGNVGVYCHDIAMDDDGGVYMVGSQHSSDQSGGMIWVGVRKSFTSPAAGSFYATNTMVRGGGITVDKSSGVIYMSGNLAMKSISTPYTVDSVSYSAPVAFVAAFANKVSSITRQKTYILENGAADGIMMLNDWEGGLESQFLAMGATYGPSFAGKTTTGVTDGIMFTSNFTFVPSAMPTAKPTRSPSLTPSLTPSQQPTSSGTRKPTIVPSLEPSMLPSENPSAVPSAVPSLDPSVGPSPIPSASPSETPSAAPSAGPTAPSVAPSVDPTAMPSSENPSAVPTKQPSESPSEQPTVAPTAPTPAPTKEPTAWPSVSPSEEPTAVPTINPSADPSALPTVSPSATPTVDPSAAPSAGPTVSPSALPSAIPSVAPTCDPSIAPSALPSVLPSKMPSAVPTITPSADPSALPTVLPSATPTANPSTAPSCDPTIAPTPSPSARPSVTPSAEPTVQRSLVPTASPSINPTASPSVSPTTRPTDATVTNLVLRVKQDVMNLDAATYNAKKVAYNVTFQETIAASLDGITPQGVTDIQVTDQTANDARVSAHAGGAVPQCSLQYTLTKFDAQVAFSVFEAQLQAAVSAGTMDAHFRYQAGLHGIDNSSYFGAPLAIPAGGSRSDEGLTGTHIALIVISIVLALTIIAFAVGFCVHVNKDPEDESPEKELDF